MIVSWWLLSGSATPISIRWAGTGAGDGAGAGLGAGVDPGLLILFIPF